jgi:tetratricopeptide (TPR) repeat protein
MSPTGKKSGKPNQPALSELMARYLERQTTAHGEGFGTPDSQEVVPHEAGPLQPVDPELAWMETLEVLPYFSRQSEANSLKAPPDWPMLVAGQEPFVAVAFCLGNFPQLVRNLQPLLHAKEPGALRSFSGRPLTVPALQTWAEQAVKQKQFPQCLLALATLRLAKQFDTAAACFSELKQIPREWKAAWDNEHAAFLCHRGQSEEALSLWQSQEPSVPVLFNRGIASLFLNKLREARSWLNQAVTQIPETSSWHHLGRLYMALAETGE